MTEYPSKETSDSRAVSPPPLPPSDQLNRISEGFQIQPAKFGYLKAFLVFHFVLTLIFFLGHIFNGLPESLRQGYLRNINLELIRIVTSGAHLACLAGIFKMKIWGWRGYKIVWVLSLLLHLMVGSLDFILLILFAFVFTGIIYVLLNKGGPSNAMKRLQ